MWLALVATSLTLVSGCGGESTRLSDQPTESPTDSGGEPRATATASPIPVSTVPEVSASASPTETPLVAGRNVSPPASAPTVPPTATTAPPPTPVAQTGSGIEGITEADPQCPISTPDNPCPPKPVSKTIAVNSDGGREVARVTSGIDGRFRISLPAGIYVITEVLAGAGPPSLKPLRVVVPPATFVRVAVLFDTGIR